MLILVFILSTSLFNPSSGACSGGQFKCVITEAGADKCIDNSLVQNTVNDCGDNSDEVTYTCPPKGTAFRFHCKGLERCIGMDEVLDVFDSCEDGLASDETKLIGTACDDSKCCVDKATSAYKAPTWCCTCSTYIPNSECQNGACACKVGYTQNALKTSCLPRVLGDSCSLATDCAGITGGTCTSSICSCITGYHQTSPTSCLQQKLNDACQESQACSQSIPSSNCTNSKCVCVPGYKASVALTTCTKRSLGESCSLETDCSLAVANSNCTDSKQCSCHDYFVVSADGAQCLKRKLGNSCTSNAQCAHGVTNGQCVGGSCNCPAGLVARTDNAACVTRKIHGSGTENSARCISNSDCTTYIKNSGCYQGVCKCNPGYNPDQSFESCDVNSVGSSCNKANECNFDRSTCTAGKCSCLQGHMARGIRDCQLREVNDPCSSDSDCPWQQAGCRVGKCGCSPGYHASQPKICVKSSLGSPCKDDLDCFGLMPNSGCTHSLCFCRTGYIMRGDPVQCELRQLHSPCIAQPDCAAAVPNSVCLGGKCACDVTFYVDRSNRSCIERKLNDKCTANTQCAKVSNSVCDNNVCACGNSYLPQSNQCVGRRLGENCKTTDDCTPAIANAECTDSKCACAEKYFQNGGKCAPYTVGSSCATDSSVCARAVPNSECCQGTNKCCCTSGYKLTEDGKACREARVGDMCKTNCTRCNNCDSLQYGACTNGVCACSENYIALPTSSTCTKVLALGEPCQMDSQCQLSIRNSSCHNVTRQCVCLPGLAGPERNRCVPVAQQEVCSDQFSCRLWPIAAVAAVILVAGGAVATGLIVKNKNKTKGKVSSLLSDTKKPEYIRPDTAPRPMTQDSKMTKQHPAELLDTMYEVDESKDATDGLVLKPDILRLDGSNDTPLTQRTDVTDSPR